MKNIKHEVLDQYETSLEITPLGDQLVWSSIYILDLRNLPDRILLQTWRLQPGSTSCNFPNRNGRSKNFPAGTVITDIYQSLALYVISFCC